MPVLLFRWPNFWHCYEFVLSLKFLSSLLSLSLSLSPLPSPMVSATGDGVKTSSSFMDCLGRIPYASLIALILCWLGVALFSAMMLQAIDASAEQAKRFLNPDMPWLDKIHLTFICVAIIMAIFGLVLLIVGALATGSTRTKVYLDLKARLGGRVSCACCLVLTYLLKLCWLAVYTVSVVLAFIYMVFQHLCHEPNRQGFAENTCLNFTVLGPFFQGNGTVSNEGTLVFCGGKLRQFCALTDTAAVFFWVGTLGCAIVVISLVHFAICLAANYAHIKADYKYVKLEEIIRHGEENEMGPMGVPRTYY